VENKKVHHLSMGMVIVSKEPGNSMSPIIKSRQPVKIQPAGWKDVKKGDIVYCKVRGNYYTHLVSAVNDKRGCQISNNHGHINGWTKNVYGKVVEILPV